MDLTLTEDQQAIAELAGRIMTDMMADDKRTALYAGEAPFDRDLWAQLAEAGLLGVCVSEAAGGSAMGLFELGLVLEAQGKVLAPVPLLTGAGVAALALDRFGDDALKQDWLSAFVAGEKILTAAIPSARLGVYALPVFAGGVLSGSFDMVPFGAACDGLVGFCDAGLVFVDLKAPGVTLTPQEGMSGESADYITFDKTPAVLLAGNEAASPVLHTALALQGAVQVGVVEEALQRTAAYTNERKQFNRRLSSFQAVSQQAADAYMLIETLRTMMWKALSVLEDGKDATAEAHAVKWWLCEAGHKVGHTALHLHGGIGQDIDYPIHRYFLWAKHHGMLFGTPTEHLAAIGRYAAHAPLLTDFVTDHNRATT